MLSRTDSNDSWSNAAVVLITPFTGSTATNPRDSSEWMTYLTESKSSKPVKMTRLCKFAASNR